MRRSSPSSTSPAPERGAATRVVVVTGAAGGVGRATVDLFHDEGWYVVAVDRVQRTDSGGADRFVNADVAVNESVEGIADLLADLGHVDALVNNAAIQIHKTISETTPSEWDAIMATNLRGAYLMTRVLHPLLRVRGGAVVNVSSVHAVATSRAIGAYAVSKGAVVSLTRSSALDLAADHIRVNAVLPGAVDTPLLRDGLSAKVDGTVEEGMRRLSARTPLGRIGRPEEIASAIHFLADSGRSSFITGQLLIVDGGATVRLSTE